MTSSQELSRVLVLIHSCRVSGGVNLLSQEGGGCINPLTSGGEERHRKTQPAGLPASRHGIKALRLPERERLVRSSSSIQEFPPSHWWLCVTERRPRPDGALQFRLGGSGLSRVHTVSSSSRRTKLGAAHFFLKDIFAFPSNTKPGVSLQQGCDPGVLWVFPL